MVRQHFTKEERGAVTADWLVLSAGLLGIGIAVLSLAGTGLSSLSDGIADYAADDRKFAADPYFGVTFQEYINSIPWETQTPQQQVDLFSNYTDPTHYSDSDLQNEFQTWRLLAADPGYPEPAFARERLALLRVVLDARQLGA